jgi:hypothetical protein
LHKDEVEEMKRNGTDGCYSDESGINPETDSKSMMRVVVWNGFDDMLKDTSDYYLMKDKRVKKYDIKSLWSLLKAKGMMFMEGRRIRLETEFSNVRIEKGESVNQFIMRIIRSWIFVLISRLRFVNRRRQIY